MGSIGNKNIKNILAFGDSLTKGYHHLGTKYHPYSIKLNELIKKNNLNYKVVDSGVNGETSGKMIERIKTQNIKQYDLVIIFAGTNDLGFSSHDKIIKNIMKLHEYVLSESVSSVHVTLPESECDTLYKDFFPEKRKKVNESVIKAITELNTDKINICDLDKEMKYSSMTKEERTKYWDDYIHFTPEGYDLIAEIIFKNIKHVL